MFLNFIKEYQWGKMKTKTVLYKVVLTPEFQSLYKKGVAEKAEMYEDEILQHLPDNLDQVSTIGCAHLIEYFRVQDKPLDDILGNMKRRRA